MENRYDRAGTRKIEKSRRKSKRERERERKVERRIGRETETAARDRRKNVGRNERLPCRWRLHCFSKLARERSPALVVPIRARRSINT